MAAILSMVSPAAMVTSTKLSRRSASTGAISDRSPAIIWGFTPRKMYAASAATVRLSPAAQPSSPASASAFAAVRLDRMISPAGSVRQAALASADPMFPAPIKPNVYALIPITPIFRSTYFSFKKEKYQKKTFDANTRRALTSFCL